MAGMPQTADKVMSVLFCSAAQEPDVISAFRGRNA